MEIVMGLPGLDSLDKLREEILKSVAPVVPPGPFSAFPFLNLPSQEYDRMNDISKFDRPVRRQQTNGMG